MKGPELSSPSQPKLSIASDFRTIQSKPASARVTTVSGLNPESTYYFRIIPKAGRTAGEQSEQHRIGPGDEKVLISSGIKLFLIFWDLSLQYLFSPKYHWLKLNSKHG